MAIPRGSRARGCGLPSWRKRVVDYAFYGRRFGGHCYYRTHTRRVGGSDMTPPVTTDARGEVSAAPR
jgi:hypothetical protein